MRSSGWSLRIASVQPCPTRSRNFARASGENKRVLGPALGLVDVLIGGDDVEVADQHRRTPLSSRSCACSCEPVHPRELVVELRPGPWIAIGQHRGCRSGCRRPRPRCSGFARRPDRREGRGGFRPDRRHGSGSQLRSSCLAVPDAPNSRAPRSPRRGKASSVHFSSCSPTMSGWNSSSQRVSTCSRGLIPLML